MAVTIELDQVIRDQMLFFAPPRCPALKSRFRPDTTTAVSRSRKNRPASLAISNVVYESSMLAKIGVADPSEIKQTTEEFLKKSGKAEKEG